MRQNGKSFCRTSGLTFDFGKIPRSGQKLIKFGIFEIIFLSLESLLLYLLGFRTLQIRRNSTQFDARFLTSVPKCGSRRRFRGEGGINYKFLILARNKKKCSRTKWDFFDRLRERGPKLQIFRFNKQKKTETIIHGKMLSFFWSIWGDISPHLPPSVDPLWHS